jgi:Icc protein
LTGLSQNAAVRILHITDPHLFADAADELRGTKTYDSLAEVIAHVQSSGWQADLVVATGDIVQDDSAAAYERFRELLEPLGLPVYCIPGNHDVRRLMKAALKAALSEPPFHYCATATLGNWLLMGIDSCREGHAGGAVGAAEMDRLEAEVSVSEAEHVLVCIHHPPVPMNSRWLDEVGLANAAELLARLQALGRVRVVLFGHVHQAYDEQHGTVRIIGTPSTCRQFLPASDTFAVDDKPPAYRRVTLAKDGTFDTELVWIR